MLYCFFTLWKNTIASWQKTGGVCNVSDDLMIQVRNEGERVVIGRGVKGGAAERSGNLHPGGRDHDYDDYEEEEKEDLHIGNQHHLRMIYHQRH